MCWAEASGHLDRGSSQLRIAVSQSTDQPDVQSRTPRQLLHLVFGGELSSIESITFNDLSQLDIVGIYPSYAEAYKAWQGVAQRTVDNAHMRYFIVHIHRLLDPAATP